MLLQNNLIIRQLVFDLIQAYVWKYLAFLNKLGQLYTYRYLFIKVNKEILSGLLMLRSINL